ncbi:hypothetical protein PRIPAC_73420, partial [Pristionchus pacificus]|uniref:Uncharacterized protein n=1 Tax=Pristionchus pacificus TaxID=54126 RepID=A0A2A6C7L4_PRIPA
MALPLQSPSSSSSVVASPLSPPRSPSGLKGMSIKFLSGLQARKSTKTVFDVTSSGANGGSTLKMTKLIVLSTLENPRSESFRESTFLSWANPCSTLSQTASYFPTFKFRSDIDLLGMYDAGVPTINTDVSGASASSGSSSSGATPRLPSPSSVAAPSHLAQLQSPSLPIAPIFTRD